MSPLAIVATVEGVVILALLFVVAWYQDRLDGAWRRLSRCPGECGLSTGGPYDDAA